ncbi:ribosome-inactivating family protein [Streptomyces sp. NPDC091377]|uniref:ribosome-inactivating family protein n=1 Tax=Streptomyces sp. NPDC091377 TaxID=3365995 RepID=UPI003808105C
MVVQNGDTHAYAAGYESDADSFRAMIQFLRLRFDPTIGTPQDPDARFVRVDFALDYGAKAVRVYILKQNLYVQGWSIGHVGATERYLAAVPSQAAPQQPTPVRTDRAISSNYSEAAPDFELGGFQLITDLDLLYNHVDKLVKTGKGTPAKAEEAFHRLIIMTAEMARFGGFCEEFLKDWPESWSQYTRLTTPAGAKTMYFNEAVKKWDDLSAVVRGTKPGLRYAGRDVGRAEATQIMGAGALHQ